MIPVTQTKVVIKNSKDEFVQRGNCYAAAIASIIELPISEVPNVEVFFHLDNGYWAIVMHTFLESKGWELVNDQQNLKEMFHPINPFPNVKDHSQYYNRPYLISGKSSRGVYHTCVYNNGTLVHDPHPSREGLITLETFESLIKPLPIPPQGEEIKK